MDSPIYEKCLGLFDYNWYPEENDPDWKEILVKIVNNESVLHLDDLVLRRTSIGDNPVRTLDLAQKISYLFNWDFERIENERDRLKNSYFTIKKQ